MRREKAAHVNRKSALDLLRQDADPIFHHQIPEYFFIAKDCGKTRQPLDNRWAEIAFEKRQQFVPYARPKARAVAICRVLAPILTFRVEVFTKGGSANVEQRSYDFGSHGINPHNASRTRSARDAAENRLCLIIPRVRNRDFRAASLQNHSLEA